MSTATITQANKANSIADFFGKIRDFAIEMYTAHGGWFVHDAAQPASGAFARGQQANGASKLLILGAAYENYAPALAAELRRIDSKE